MLISVSNRARNEKYQDAKYLHQNWEHQLNVDSVDPWDELYLIEKAFKGVENLRCWIAYNIEGWVEHRRDADLESRNDDDNLKIIQN